MRGANTGSTGPYSDNSGPGRSISKLGSRMSGAVIINPAASTYGPYGLVP